MNKEQKYPLEYFDETLDINATENYDLTVEISEEGLTMAILDLLRGKYVMLRHYGFPDQGTDAIKSINDIVSSDDFLRKHYSKVIVITPELRSTIVPSPLFDPSLKNEYFNFNLTDSDITDVFSNTLSNPGASVLFSPLPGLSEILSATWPGVNPWHHIKPLLCHSFTSCRSSDDRYVHLHLEKSFITIIVIEKQKLLFCNNFKCSTPGDIGYYLFNVFDKIAMKNGDLLNVSGAIEPYGELHLSILNFTESIKFASPQMRYSLSYVFSELPLYRWLNLFTASSCE